MRTSTTLLYSLLFSLPGLALGTTGDPKSLPPELKRLVAKGESVLAYESADLNGDGLGDIVFIVEPLQSARGKQEDEEEATRTLKIAIRSSNGLLKVVKENSMVVLCEGCGGVFGDPFAGLSAATNTFSVNHYGGSGWRWSTMAKFNYSRRDATWQLVEVDESSFHASEPDKQKNKTYRPPRSFGKIDIADFDPGNFQGVGAK
jgi:hypothetical protein